MPQGHNTPGFFNRLVLLLLFFLFILEQIRLASMANTIYKHLAVGYWSFKGIECVGLFTDTFHFTLVSLPCLQTVPCNAMNPVIYSLLPLISLSSCSLGLLPVLALPVMEYTASLSLSRSHTLKHLHTHVSLNFIHSLPHSAMDVHLLMHYHKWSRDTWFIFRWYCVFICTYNLCCIISVSNSHSDRKQSTL